MIKNRQIFIFENSNKLTNALYKHWMEIAQQSIQEHDMFTTALSGGKTPSEFYCRLSGIKDFDFWKSVHLFLTDERFVPFSNEESNFRMLEKNLINYINIPSENIHPIYTDQGKITICADRYEAEIKHFFKLEGSNDLPRFDLTFLGVGEDGHVASLFPNDEPLLGRGRLVRVSNQTHLPTQRISLNFPVINHSKNIIFILTGAHKAEIVKRLLIDRDPTIPATHINPLEGQIFFYLDKNAAKKIDYKDSFKHLDEGIALTI